jgi:squalene cyclase
VERLQKLRENGGDEKCERAVSNALEWLRAKQNADGSWGRQHKGAMTGLALLCYLGRCYDADSVYGDTVSRAMLQLVELAQKNPRHIFSETPEQHAAAYEHGIATYALGELWSFMRLGQRQMPGVREAFERGVQTIIENQLPDGGWGYGEDFCYRKTGAGDLSVTGWQFQALKAAHYSGLKIDGLHKSIDRAVDYLASKQSKDGGFGVTNREQGYNQWNLTGVGLLGLQTLGKGRTKEIKRGVQFVQDFIAKEPPQWERNANLYAWYYLAQSMFQEGGEAWSQWNSAVLPQLLANQTTEGSWRPETADNSIGSTAPAGADREVYRTTLCTLMLEVYFRYLKVGDRDSGSPFAP